MLTGYIYLSQFIIQLQKQDSLCYIEKKFLAMCDDLQL